MIIAVGNYFFLELIKKTVDGEKGVYIMRILRQQERIVRWQEVGGWSNTVQATVRRI